MCHTWLFLAKGAFFRIVQPLIAFVWTFLLPSKPWTYLKWWPRGADTLSNAMSPDRSEQLHNFRKTETWRSQTLDQLFPRWVIPDPRNSQGCKPMTPKNQHHMSLILHKQRVFTSTHLQIAPAGRGSPGMVPSAGFTQVTSGSSVGEQKDLLSYWLELINGNWLKINLCLNIHFVNADDWLAKD